MYKMRIGVIMGGKSIEHEVSFNSGRTVCDHLDTQIYDVVPIFQTLTGCLFLLPWHFLYRGKTTDFVSRLTTEATRVSWDDLTQLIDFMFIAMPGKYGEDGCLQGMLEVLGIPYLGSKVYASALAMDKSMQKKMLSCSNIATPRGIVLNPGEIANFNVLKQDIEKTLETLAIEPPYIVKPQHEGSSLGVRVVHNKDLLLDALMYASTIDAQASQAVLIEEKIVGMEFSCIVITDRATGKLFALPPTEIIPENNSLFFDYHQKYMPGRAHKRTPPLCSAHIIKTIQDTCINTMHALGLTNMARIDGFVSHDNRITIIDCNSLPGLDPASFLFQEAAQIDMNHTHVINHLIETELYHTNMQTTAEPSANRNQKETEKTERRMRIAVLIGGDSNEREISLASGRNIIYKLSPHKYEPIAIFVTETMKLYRISQSLLVHNTTQEIAQLLEQSHQIAWADLPHIADFVFIGLHGGKGENGCVQGALEMLNMPYNGSSVLASSLCMNKYKTNELLRAQGFDVPRSYLITSNEWAENQHRVIDTIEREIIYPLIVKPSDDGCSVMVEKIKARDQLICAINTIFAHDKKTALIEEHIIGMELTVGVIGNSSPQALVPSQAVVQDDVLSIEEKFLPGAGENQTPAPLPSDVLALVQRTVVAAYTTVGCAGYARIDCFYQSAQQSPTLQERVIILEINTLPGMTPATCLFHQAAEMGVRPMELIAHIITLGLERYNDTHRGPSAPQEQHYPERYNEYLNTTVI